MEIPERSPGVYPQGGRECPPPTGSRERLETIGVELAIPRDKPWGYVRENQGLPSRSPGVYPQGGRTCPPQTGSGGSPIVALGFTPRVAESIHLQQGLARDWKPSELVPQSPGIRAASCRLRHPGATFGRIGDSGIRSPGVYPQGGRTCPPPTGSHERLETIGIGSSIPRDKPWGYVRGTQGLRES